ncbi:MAG: hypothetical protein WBA12_05670 [Catalinimonas sp.]
MRYKRRPQGRPPRQAVCQREAHIQLQGQELEFWRSYAKELEGTFDGLENRLIALENAQAVENRKN